MTIGGGNFYAYICEESEQTDFLKLGVSNFAVIPSNP